MSRIRCYSDLLQLQTFDERFAYLKLEGSVGRSTFGFDRWINQEFYRSTLWKRARRDVISRDLGCDLGISGFEINSGLLVHHMNPLVADDVIHGEEDLINPEFLITTCQVTHNAIHYGNPSPYPPVVRDRSVGDTKLW